MDNRLKKFLSSYDELYVPSLDDRIREFTHKRVVIYGAGSFGIYIYKILKEHGIAVEAFLDQAAPPGAVTCGVMTSVANSPLLDTTWKKQVTVVLALSKDYISKREVIASITACGFDNVIDAQSIRCFDVTFDNKGEPINPKRYVERMTDNIYKALDLLSDDESREIYVQNVISHLGRDYSNCIESVGVKQYFPVLPRTKGYSRFIDCGGYTGDTITNLIKEASVDAIASFEPNAELFSTLSRTVDTMRKVVPEVYLYPCAVSDKTSISKFILDGGSSRLTDSESGVYVQSVAIDDVLKGFKPTFIKMDIEGAEPYAIIGAKYTIQEHVPDLAISVYHNINHLWDIPLLINCLADYDMYLRVHSSYTMETILYGVAK